MTQHTIDDDVTAVTNCRVNCVETSRPQRWGPDLPFFVLIKARDVETNPGATTTHKQVWICDICHTKIHGRKQISIR